MFARLSSVWLFFAFLVAAPGLAQTAEDMKALRRQIDEMQESQKQIQKELEGVRQVLLLLARQGRGQQRSNIQLNLDGALILGDKNARLTLVEYFDYQCPFCATFSAQTLPHLVSEYVRKGNVNYLIRDFPLESLHPQALKAAEAARCAGDQGKKWQMHDALVANSKALDRPSLSRYAKDVGLDVIAFDACVDRDKYAEQIRQEKLEGEKFGVEGTPIFYLGVIDPDGKTFRSSQVLEGAVSFARLKQSIDTLLSRQEQPNTEDQKKTP